MQYNSGPLERLMPEKNEAVTQERLDESFRVGFITGWIQCVGDKETNKKKLKQIAGAAFENYIKNQRRGF
jgi:hypothetical protein